MGRQCCLIHHDWIWRAGFGAFVLRESETLYGLQHEAALPAAGECDIDSARSLQSSSALCVVRAERSISKRRQRASRLLGIPGKRVLARTSVSIIRVRARMGR